MPRQLEQKDFEIHSFTTEFDFKTFKCENRNFEQYPRKDAQADHDSRIGRVFIMIEKNTKKIVGFVTIAMGEIPKNKDESEGKPKTRHGTIPGVLLGQLGAHRDYPGVGTMLLDFVTTKAADLAVDIGCRVVYVRSVEGKEWWYAKKGFTLVKKTKRTFFFDLFLDEPEKY